MSKYFDVVVADPPWSFSDKLTMSDVKRGASSNYSTMTINDIKALKVNQLANPDGCVLALWCPSSLLMDGLEVMKGWGFNHKQSYIWVKTKKDLASEVFGDMKDLPIFKDKNISKQSIKNTIADIKKQCKVQLNDFLQFGLGRLFRQTHELALIGINNSGIYKKLENRSQRSVCFAPNLKHSAKPEDLQNALEVMFPKPAKYLELFARRQRFEWTCLGNEIGNKEDIRLSIEGLL